jgi:hypothetical protein
VAGPTSSAICPAPTPSTPTTSPSGRVEAVGHHEVGGEQHRDLLLRGAGEHVAGGGELVALHQGLAHGAPLRGEEGVGHRAADDERVDLAEQRLDDGDLVAHLGAAEHGDVGALGAVDEAAQGVELLAQEKARGAEAHELRQGVDRGVGAVRGAEGVVHVHVAGPLELAREARRRWPPSSL